MKRYLNPKADLVFKRIFGEHADILKSFLNAMLPLPEGRKIKELSYLPAEQVPKNPAFKNMIADVKCKDEQGNIFIVEMQTQWIGNFYKRLVFGASRAYVNQLRPSKSYDNLLPVLALGILDDVVRKDTDEWYHHYRFTDSTDIEQKNTIDHLQLLLIELPKFKPQSHNDKKMQVLWLRFLSEISGEIENVPEELLAVPEIKTALSLSEEAGYTLSQLDAYEDYLDAVRVQKEIERHNEERKKVNEEHEKANEEHKKVNEEHKKVNEEHKKVNEEHKKVNEEHKKVNEEHKKVNEEHKKVNEEHKKANEEHKKANEERKKANEEHKKANEEHKKANEERKKALDQYEEECKKKAEQIAKEAEQIAKEAEQKTNEIKKQAKAVKKSIEEIEENKRKIAEIKAEIKTEAEKSAKLEITKNLIKQNADPKMIASVTGLPMRDIKQLADFDCESAMV